MCCNGYICEKKFRIIIDSKAFINIISKIIFCELQITDQPKKNFYGFITTNESKILKQKTINKKTKLLPMQIQQHNKHIIFDIINITNHQIILKIL